MMINNKIKALEEHNRRLDEQMQSMQQELQDSIAENQKQ
jgi:chaperonin cofactor prefoldin